MYPHLSDYVPWQTHFHDVHLKRLYSHLTDYCTGFSFPPAYEDIIISAVGSLRLDRRKKSVRLGQDGVGLISRH